MLVPIRHLPDGPAAVLLVAGRELLLDPEDYPRVSRVTVFASDGYPVRRYSKAGRTYKQILARWLLAPAEGVRVRYRNGNSWDCRRQNLRIVSGAAWRVRERGTKPWQARVRIDGRLYDLGYWPTRAWALDICELVAPVAAECRRSDLTPREIRRRLRIAAGLQFEDDTRRTA